MPIGYKIKQLREAMGVTQKQFAAAIGEWTQSLSRWENGISSPNAEKLPKIAEALSVSILTLFEQATARPTPMMPHETIHAFIAEKCELDESARIPRSDMYAAYAKWAQNPISRNVFGKLFLAAAPTVWRRCVRNRYDRYWEYVGVRLR